jgi:hypothetical protein
VALEDEILPLGRVETVDVAEVQIAEAVVQLEQEPLVVAVVVALDPERPAEHVAAALVEQLS